MIRIIGLGSPFGDDAVGLAIVRELTGSMPPEVDVVAADRPGVGLIDLLDGAEAVILIDAVRSQSPPGTLHDLDLHRLPAAPPWRVSAHAVGASEALTLAACLGRMPTRGRFLGIEAAPESALPCAPLSSGAAAGMAAAVRRVQLWLRLFDGPQRG